MKPQAPTVAQMRVALNKQGMYSPLEKAALAIPRTKGTPAEFMAEISKQPGFRKEEVEDRKISLPEQKMTKEEFLGHLKNHPAPLISEKELGGENYREALDQMAQGIIGDQYATFDDLDYRDKEAVKYDVSRDFGYDPEPKYDEWALPGGENYRELLLKLPQRGLNEHQRKSLMGYEANIRRGDQLDPWHQKQYDELKAREAQQGQDYISHHWKDDPNVLAHIRLSDRTGPNGEKILHVDEIQSDWHQAGRKHGYKKEDVLKKDDSGNWIHTKPNGETVNFGPNIDEQTMRAALAGSSAAVPDAPFKKNWHELALKHVLGLAAKGGYHGIAITPGEKQAERYDLSSHVKNIYHSANADGTFHASVLSPEGKVIWEDFRAPPEKIEETLGKDIAHKIVNGVGEDEGGMRRLDPEDMKMGGEGMKGFYDKIVPTFLNKLGKPHGAQVGTINVAGDPTKRPEIMQQMGVDPIRFGLMPREQRNEISKQADAQNQQPLHYFPITDSMRQQIKQEGLPQYDKGGKVDPIEQMRRELAANGRGPIGMDALKQNVQGAWQVLKDVPGNLRRLATDPVAYIRSLPAPTGEQIMNMAGPGNIGFAGMMIGPKARTWHTGRAQMAEAMETAGRTPEEIWKATGTLKGPDGIWRQEISDKGSTFNMIDDLKLKAQEYKDMIEAKKALLAPDKSGQKDFWPKALTEAKRPVREEIAGLKGDLSEMSRSPRTQGVPARWTLDHPELYAAYPQLADLPIVQNYKSGPEKGSLTSSGSRLYQMDVHDPTNPRSTALHEMQHAIQGIEGMTPGANPMMAFQAPEYPAILNRIRSNPEEFEYLKMAPRERDKAALEWYRRQHGEAEARATQARRDMSDAERAAKYPYESFDVPREQLLTRQSESNPGKVTEARGGSVHPLLPDFEE